MGIQEAEFVVNAVKVLFASLIESIKTTSVEDVSTGVLEKNKNI